MQIYAKKGNSQISIATTNMSDWMAIGYTIVAMLPYDLDTEDIAQLNAGASIAIQSVKITPPTNQVSAIAGLPAQISTLSTDETSTTVENDNGELANEITKEVLELGHQQLDIVDMPYGQTIEFDRKGRIVSVVNKYRDAPSSDDAV